MTEALSITRTVQIQASQQKVWQALTEADLIAQWFGNHATIDLRPGGAMWLRWDEYDAEGRAEVVEVSPISRFSFRWERTPQTGPLREDNLTLVVFELSEQDGGTSLTVTESEWEKLALSETEIRSAMEDNRGGWVGELNDLIAFLEK
ncbi:SRPBCC domain-containing protein [Psychromicrobium lacuslunae]|uniref:Activator of Hsp90 ATPase homologue 1/2-like C-terminal domain-containing protein n=1 Tax=Psychromicrobium lacuslunae TaxID=1618207 RepID=A0A0D4BX00_9MICC|nr:SRPBCC domain-containing protein [Psychromicrobium lacuslunae]AJT40848.1 hypothetical protein UM93_03775 [Psychromicrobium lacuslunae]